MPFVYNYSLALSVGMNIAGINAGEWRAKWRDFAMASARAMRAGFPNFAHSAGCLERCRSQPALPLWNKEQRRVWDGTTFGAACRYDSPVPPATMAGGAAPP